MKKHSRDFFSSYAGLHMAQEISAQSTKPNEHGQENLNWKKTSRIKLLSKIIFKICVSKLQQESIGKSRSQLSYTEASFQTKQEFMSVLLFIAKAVLLKKDIWTVIKGWCGGSRKFKTDQTIYGRQVYQWLVKHDDAIQWNFWFRKFPYPLAARS